MPTICQSCGMPMNKDPNGGGTELDGSKSKSYCSYCYNTGAFVAPNMTAKEMQAFCKDKMQEMGMPGPLAWLLTRNIPKLKRWRI